jgi:hypothetical protein
MGSTTILCLTDVDVRRYIGFPHLRDYTAIHKCGTGVQVVSHGEPQLSQADLTTIKQKNKGKPLSLPKHILERADMDIGYGHPDSPVGFKYFLLIDDYNTRHKYIYEPGGITGADIHNALLVFFIETGGIPGKIQWDFDTKFITGSASQLLLDCGIHLQAPPGGRQSQNGLAESHWKHSVCMARALLIDLGIPKRL